MRDLLTRIAIVTVMYGGAAGIGGALGLTWSQVTPLLVVGVLFGVVGPVLLYAETPKERRT